MLGRLYRPFIDALNDDTEGWISGNSFEALLLKSTYTFNAEHTNLTSLTLGTNEVSVAGYSRVTLPALPTLSRTGNIISVTFGTLGAWGPMTAEAANAPAYAVVFRVGASEAESPLVFIQDFEGPVDVVTDQISVAEPAGGFIRQIIDPSVLTP